MESAVSQWVDMVTGINVVGVKCSGSKRLDSIALSGHDRTETLTLEMRNYKRLERICQTNV